MTPRQLKRKPFEKIIKIGYEELDTEEGESKIHEEESTTSTDMSEQDSASDTTTIDTDQSKPTETLQIHNVHNTTMHDEDDSINDDDSSEDENMTEIETHIDNGSKTMYMKTNSLLPTLKLKLKTKKWKGS